MMCSSWIPVLAAIPTDPAQRVGYLIGFVVGLLLIVGVGVFGVVSIIMAFTRRTTAWIVMGSISGLLIVLMGVALGVAVVTGFSKGFAKGLNNARERSEQAQKVETITGKVIPFTIEKPVGWSVKRDQGTFDAILTDRSGYVGIIAEKADLGSNEPLVNFARKRFETIGTELSLSDNETATIDGRTWIGFTARCKVDNLPFAYHCYVHSGKEGSIQLMAWTFQNQWESEAAELDRVMHTVHLPDDAMAHAPVATPAVPAKP